MTAKKKKPIRVFRPQSVKSALAARVLDGEQSIRAVAAEAGVPESGLTQWVKKERAARAINGNGHATTGSALDRLLAEHAESHPPDGGNTRLVQELARVIKERDAFKLTLESYIRGSV